MGGMFDLVGRLCISQKKHLLNKGLKLKTFLSYIFSFQTISHKKAIKDTDEGFISATASKRCEHNVSANFSTF